MKKGWIFVIVIGVAVFTLIFWVLFRDGGEAVLVLNPPDGEKFAVRWRVRLSDVFGTSFFERRNEHTQETEAEMQIERKAGNFRLLFVVHKVVRSGDIFDKPNEGDRFSLFVDKTYELKDFVGEIWMPPQVFWLFPLLNGRYTKLGEEWIVQKTLEGIPYISGEKAVLKMRLVSASAKTAFLEGELSEPKIVKISLLDMQVKEANIELEFDKERRFIRRCYAKGELKALSGAQFIEFEGELLCIPVS